MKTIKHLLPAILSLFLMLTIVSCEKSGDGEPGPKGDKGDKGDTGAVGPAGTSGTAGTPGTANVTYSEWFGPNNNGGSAWTGTTTSGRLTNTFSKAAAGITESAINNSVILVYAKLFSYGTVYGLNSEATSLLPIVSSMKHGTGFKTESWSPSFRPGFVDVHFQNSIDEWPTTSMASTYRFRYVIIPGGTSGARMKAVDHSNYEAVKRAYNIPD